MRGSSSGSRHISKRIRFRQGWRVLLRIGHGQALQGQAKACPTGIALATSPLAEVEPKGPQVLLWETGARVPPGGRPAHIRSVKVNRVWGYNESVMTRRELLAAALAAPLVRAAGARIPIGITDWNLRLSANPEAIPLAARLGFDGIQISCGRRLVEDKMPLDNPAAIARCLALSK